MNEQQSQALSEALEKAVEVIKAVWEAVKELVAELVKRLSRFWDWLISQYSNPRIVRLAFHSKKKRVRKKNRKRMYAEFRKAVFV